MLGKAIIATDVDSNGEIISDGKTGLLVAAKDSQALANAMTRLIQEPRLRESLGTASRQKYEQHFNLDQIVKQKIIPLYKQP
jgi:glycosyltransferase involved in cell wall biosynthesis